MLELIEAKDTDAILFYIVVRVAVVLACWIFVIVSNVVDFWSGVSTAKALGEPLMSHGFRRTVQKIADYARVLLFALMLDALGSLFHFYVLPFATILGAVAVMCIEGSSVVENSKRKKAHAAEVPDIVRQIVQAATTEQGIDMFNKIANYLALTKKHNEKNK